MAKLLTAVLALVLLTVGCSTKTKESLCSEGIKQMEAGSPSAAVIYFKNALEKDGNFNDARFQLAKAYAAMGKLEQAEKELSKVLKQNPSRDDATLQLASVLNQEGKAAEGLRLAQQYLTKHPQEPEGLEVLGNSCAGLKMFPDAENYYLQALKLAPQRSQTKLQLASLNLAMGRVGPAKLLLDGVVQADPRSVKALYMLAALEKTTGNLDKAVADYRRIIALKGSETTALYKVGLIQIEKGELDKADASAGRMIKDFPKRGDGYRLKGLVSFYRKKYADAIASLQASQKTAPSYEGYYFLGLSFYNQGEFESALSQFRKILDVLPDSRQSRLMAAQILLKQKRAEDCIAEVKKVLQRNDGDALAHDLLGTAYMAQGQFQEGMRELDRATRLDPKLVSAHIKKGYYYFSKGSENAGESELATAVQAAPDQLNNRLLLASYYKRQNKNAKALTLLRGGLTGGRGDAPLYNAIAAVEFSSGDHTEAVRSLQKGKQVDPSFEASYRNLAAYYASLNDYPRAIGEYGSLLRAAPSSLSAMLGLAALYEISGKEGEALAQYRRATKGGQPEAYLAQARYLQKKGDNDQAVQVLDESIRLDARSPAPLELKGRILLSAKRYQEALKAFDQVEALNHEAGISLKIGAYLAMGDGARAAGQARRVIARYPNSARGYLVLASVYQGQKDLGSAEREAQTAVRVEPKSVEARLYLGGLLESRGSYDTAMLQYQDALRLEPNSPAARFARGALLDKSGKKREAARIYRSIIGLTDSFVPALNNLSLLCADGAGSREEALRLAMTAFRLEPGNPAIMDTLGYALLKNGRKADAVKLLERAVALLPQEPAVRNHLALAYRESGDKLKAEQLLRRGVSMGDPAARSLLAGLGK